MAIEDQAGDQTTFKVACRLKDFGCSEQAAFELMLEHWNHRCSPAWPDDELLKKVENGFKYGESPPGVASPESDFGKPANPVSFSDVLTRQVPPVQEVIEGLVEKGTVTFLSGPGGTHKSRLGVQWGLSIDSGIPIFSRAVQRSHFVYVSYEDHADEVTRRAQAIARRLSIDTCGGEFWNMAGKDAPLAIVQESGECQTRPFWDVLHSHLKAIPGHKFLVIDSTYNALRFVASAKINEGAVMAAIGLLQRLCDETDSTILILWHPSQAGQDRGDASGWSVAWHNAPRARLSISQVKDTEDSFTLKVEKRNHGPKGKAITLHWSDGALLPRAETAIAEQEDGFGRAVIRIATKAAETGAPIQRQKHLDKWQLDSIADEMGRRPSEREVKDALAASLPAGRLKYMAATRHRMAGYYPTDKATTGCGARCETG